MKWLPLTLFLILSLSSCGQELRSQRVVSEGQQENVLQVQNCQQTSGPVCGQPPMPICPADMACAQVMPMARTYANECEMVQDKAEFIQNGECPTGAL